MAILQHPSNEWYPSPWFTRDYGFFSPTPMYWPQNDKETVLKKGDKIKLRYRVLVHAGDVTIAKIAEQFELSRQFWAYLVNQNLVSSPQSFIKSIPHISFVWEQKNVDFLKKRFDGLTQNILFKGMNFFK